MKYTTLYKLVGLKDEGFEAEVDRRMQVSDSLVLAKYKSSKSKNVCHCESAGNYIFTESVAFPVMYESCVMTIL